MFGEVTDGMDIVLQICDCPKAAGDKPDPDVVLQKLTIEVS